MGSIGMLGSISGAAAEEGPVSWTAAQRSHCDARWEEYLRQQNLEGLWRGPLGKEQDRYRPVLESLAAEDRMRQRQSTAIREQKMKWSVKLRCQETRERLAQYKGELKTIFDAANEDLRYQTQRKQMEAAHQRHLAANHRCATRLVKLPGGSDDDACKLEVATSLSRTRYYLGHKGGDYIFRYQEFYAFYSLYREFGAGGDAWDPNGSVCHHPGSEVNLQCGEETRSDFQYCGQVPRTWKEYASRFEMVCQDIMRLFGSVISFEPLGDGVLINEVYRPCLEVTNIDVKSLNRLEKTWNFRVAKDSAFFSWVQSMAAGNSKLLEFAFLLNRLDEMSGGLFKEQVRSLVQLFGSVTDKTLPEMCEAYEGIMKEEAMKELLKERNFEHCMVFEDDAVEDPHAFYADNEFCSDLDHPRNRFNPPPIQRALETAFNLLCYDWDLRDPTSEATLTQLCDQLGLCSCRDIILPAAIERLRQRAQEPCSEPSSRDDNAAAASRPAARAARRGRPPKRRASPSAQTAARPRSSRRHNR